MREDILMWGIQKDLGEIQSLRNGFVWVVGNLSPVRRSKA